jgi:hypothetical protein
VYVGLAVNRIVWVAMGVGVSAGGCVAAGSVEVASGLANGLGMVLVNISAATIPTTANTRRIRPHPMKGRIVTSRDDVGPDRWTG